jgi:formamidopyrimidine-DNA glycosylase
MPELPEVEALAAFLREHTLGRTVAAVSVGAVSALKTVAPGPEALVGRGVVDVARHGKWLDLSTHHDDTDTGAGTAELHLVFHLARAGWLRWHDAVPARTPAPGRGPLALRVRLADGAGFDLTEAGTRKRLAVHVVGRPEDVPAIATLGVEPLEPHFTPETLTSLLRARNQQVKGLLRDQSVIAGIGNAYSDEVLHAAKESPFALTRSFDEARTRRLYDAIRDVLTSAVAAASGRPAAELKDAKRAAMRVHGRTGQPCPVCGDVVREVSFADSFLNYCATCQTEGHVLADRRMSRLLR